eukprot:6210535-Pleurochrysis_carterae.AAC.3
MTRLSASARPPGPIVRERISQEAARYLAPISRSLQSTKKHAGARHPSQTCTTSMYSTLSPFAISTNELCFAGAVERSGRSPKSFAVLCDWMFAIGAKIWSLKVAKARAHSLLELAHSKI